MGSGGGATAHADKSHPTHVDTPHVDVKHVDTAGINLPHGDAHSDIPQHLDFPRFQIHIDTPHVDTPHGDAPHGDTTHGDTPHGDHK